MKAIIKLDVPEWQIGKEVIVHFPDTMVKCEKCELLKEQPQIVHCPDCLYNKNCISTENGIEQDGFCKWGERKDGDGE